MMPAQANTRTSERGQGAAATRVDIAPSLARQCWDNSHGDYDAATYAYYAAITRDKKAMAEILPDLVRQWCRQQILSAAGAARAAAFRPADTATAAQGRRLRMALSCLLLDFPLIGGKLLRDATAGDCIESAGTYRSTASDAMWKARWLEAVANRVGDGTVGDTLSEAELAHLQQEVKDA